MEDSRPAWGLPRRIAMKAVLMVVALLSCIYVTYALIGLWNRVFGGWRSVFYCYAGSRNFISTYAPPATVDLFRWIPSPIGLLRHNGARGIVLASPLTEAEFLDPANEQAFRRMRRRLRRIAWLMGVRDINLAGILPGVLRRDDILDMPDSRQTVARAVRAAVHHLVQRRFDGRVPPVILLGGSGYVGAPTADALREHGFTLHVVDPKADLTQLPQALEGKDCLLVDISRRGVIAGYIPQMWPELAVLNETFPRPASIDIQAMAARGVDVFHLSGLTGSIVPPLPFGYENAVPCCAAHGASEVPDVQVVALAEPSARRTIERSARAA